MASIKDWLKKLEVDLKSARIVDKNVALIIKNVTELKNKGLSIKDIQNVVLPEIIKNAEFRDAFIENATTAIKSFGVRVNF